MRVKKNTGFKCDRCGCAVSAYFQDTVVVTLTEDEILLCPGCYARFKRHYTKYRSLHQEEIYREEKKLDE